MKIELTPIYDIGNGKEQVITLTLDYQELQKLRNSEPIKGLIEDPHFPYMRTVIAIEVKK